MCTDRRDFLRLSAGVAGATLLGSAPVSAQQGSQPEAVRRLRPMTDKVVPITLEERKGRIEKAQKLMREQRIDAIYLEPGSSMFYFTGMRWGTSERMFAAVIPARGEIAWVCPKFEDERARELIRMGTDIRTGKKTKARTSASPRSSTTAECAPEPSAWKSACGSFYSTVFEKPRRR